jgi:hypothetical protein
MFFYVENLTKLTLKSGAEPWDFKSTAVLSDEIRKDKRARQAWYQNPGTDHYFYTPLEPANPNMRPSKENPPRLIHAFAADFDVKIPDARVKEAIDALKLKPSYFERSLGGNVRLVWLLPRPIIVDSYEFCVFILERAKKWLNLDILPGLDEGAFNTPTRLLCLGDKWEKIEGGGIPESELQAFFVGCGKAFRFVSNDATLVPLDVVEAELKNRFPSFVWPSDFTPDTQGPSFWIPESTSPMSAILKAEGFITFSAHAAKPFYSWSDILGPEFVRQFAIESITKATTDIFWDQKRFWRKKGEKFIGLDMNELVNYFRVNCRLSPKPGADGNSTIDLALNHIYNSNDVVGGAPFAMQPAGRIEYMGNHVLNTYVKKVMQPAEGAQVWGTNFPFMAIWLDGMFDPAGQIIHFLAWFKHFYTAVLNDQPLPGQNIFLMGGAGVGKTYVNRHVIGRAVGSHVDASDFLIKNASFNSEIFESVLWCVDDETAGESEATRSNFQAMLKKITANMTFKYHKKFEVPVTIEWPGRAICTSNLDYVSSRLLGSMDNTSKDKTCLFKCSSMSNIQFPERLKLNEIIGRELPYFLRWILDWEVPDVIERDVRFGYKSFHEDSLLDQAQQGGRSAPFKEVLVESLIDYFQSNPTAKEWKGTVTKVIRLILSNPLNELVLRTMKLEQTNRYLETVQREGLVPCTIETGAHKERVWVFQRIS